MPLRLRSMNIDDLSAVYDLGCRVFDRRDTSPLWSPETIAPILADHLDACMVAHYGKTLSGFLIAVIDIARSSCRLEWLVLAPGRHRTAVGIALGNALCRFIADRGIHRITAMQVSEDAELLEILKKIGFTDAGNITMLERISPDPGVPG